MQFLVQIPNQQANRKLKLDWDYFALISLWNLRPRRTGKPASIACVMSGPTRHNLLRKVSQESSQTNWHEIEFWKWKNQFQTSSLVGPNMKTSCPVPSNVMIFFQDYQARKESPLGFSWGKNPVSPEMFPAVEASAVEGQGPRFGCLGSTWNPRVYPSPRKMVGWVGWLVGWLG